MKQYMDRFSQKTTPWRRGKNSWATTIPQQILLVKGVDIENSKVSWSINPDTGKIEVEFVEVEDDE